VTVPLFVNGLLLEIVHVPAVMLNVPVLVVLFDRVTVPAEIVAPSGPVTLLLFVKILTAEDPKLAKLTRPPALFVRLRSPSKLPVPLMVNVPLLVTPALFAIVSEPAEIVRLAPLAIMIVLAVDAPETFG
jgi:hypothetical protein